MNCGVGCRRGPNPMLLWLWCSPVATTLIRPLAWEPPYAVGAALEKAKRQKKKKEKKKKRFARPNKLQLTEKQEVSFQEDLNLSG